MLRYDTKKWTHVVATAEKYGAPFNTNNTKTDSKHTDSKHIDSKHTDSKNTETNMRKTRKTNKKHTLGTPFAQTRWRIYIYK